MLAAVLLYLDRNCMGEIVKTDSFRNDLQLTPEQTGAVLGAFYFFYAIAQVPAGWLGDRFGARGIMAFYILAWSLCTAVMGFATGFAALFAARIGLGVAQAGAYPTSAGLLTRWVPFSQRGRASSFVSFGGRMGGAIAPWLTAVLVAGFSSWRPVLLIYGGVGVLFAGVFWWMFRERPAEHPRCNVGEREFIESGAPPVVAKDTAGRIPLRALVSSGSMWLMCLAQWGTNIGWVFLVAWMPTYLRDVQQFEPVAGGRAASLVLFLGMTGTIAGGWVADAAVRKFGHRWGRCGPLAATRFAAALGYVLCLWMDSPWAFVAVFAFISFISDSGIPSTWATLQDVGGRNVGSVLGWANMWGNLGAAATAGLLPWVNAHWDSNKDWHEAFLVCAAAYVLAGAAALGIDATRPVVKG